MPAMKADQWRQRVAIGFDQAATGEPGGAPGCIEEVVKRHELLVSHSGQAKRGSESIPTALAIVIMDSGFAPLARPGMTASFRRGLSAALGFDLADSINDGVERKQCRSVPGLVVAHRLKHRDISPFAGRRGLA